MFYGLNEVFQQEVLLDATVAPFGEIHKGLDGRAKNQSCITINIRG